jgi:hypothetical protein
MHRPEDIWYALANTEILVAPHRKLETFGNTVISYHLISEKLDAVNEIRIREGKVHAERPQVLTHSYFERLLLDGFGEEAQQYSSWLRDHIKDLTFMKYGFRFRKEEGTESTIHENIKDVSARVKKMVEEKSDPLTTVIQGVDDAWEICLLKFMTDFVRKSAPDNFMDLKKRKLLVDIEGIPAAVREEIESDFDHVGSDSSKMKTLGAKLREYGIFEQYEDRFYETVRRVSR